MSIAVVRALPTEPSDPLARYALPEGFPFLVVEETMEIIEQVLGHLLKKHVTFGRGTSRWNRNTAEADAYDLRDWFDYLEHVEYDGKMGKPWDIASHYDYLEYRDALQDLISRISKKHLEDSTIRRRQLAVESFYGYAEVSGLYVGSFIEQHVSKGRYRLPVDRDPLAHIRQGGRRESKVAFGLSGTSGGSTLKPLHQREWAQLKMQIGPLPSEQGTHDLRSCRTRLATELSVTTGMRVDEVASLTTAQITGLFAHYAHLPAETRRNSYLPLRLTKTKRLVERDVLVPGYLVEEMSLYMDHERLESVRKGKSFASKIRRSFREPTTFFLNQPAIDRFAGRLVTTDTLENDFHDACIKAGLVRIEERFDPDDPTQSLLVKVASHVFHDLRHTFAVVAYQQENACGSREPWKKVQTLLGHKSLGVTRDTYLKVVDIDIVIAGEEQWHNTTNLRGGTDAQASK